MLGGLLTRLRFGLADRRAEVVAVARAQPSRLDGEKRQAFAFLGGGVKELGGEVQDLRCVPYLSWERYKRLHAE